MSFQLSLRFFGYKKNHASNQVWASMCGSSVFRGFSEKSSSTKKLNDDIAKKLEDDKLIETKPLSGYVYDEGIQGFKSKWRLQFIERKSFYKSKLGAFASKKFPAHLTRLNPENFQYFDFKKWWNKEKKEKLVYDQQFNEERLVVLGCDLAAAHFTVYRGGAVKFVGHNKWIRDEKTNKEYDEELPNQYDPNCTVEAIDFSKTKIVYEGLRNIENLRSLKWLSFANCCHFNDWCLDRVSGEHRNSLEYLDISFTDVTYRGLHALYRFNKLKTLKVDESKDDPLFFQMCLEIQKEFRGLNVELVTSEISSEEPQQIGSSSSISHAQS